MGLDILMIMSLWRKLHTSCVLQRSKLILQDTFRYDPLDTAAWRRCFIRGRERAGALGVESQ
jgi:hypothetical protein